MTVDMEKEIHKAIGFGLKVVESGEPLPPTLCGFKADSDKDRLILGCKPLDEDNYDEDKTVSFATMAGITRIWGATDVLFLCDAHVVQYPEGETWQEGDPPPREDPRSVDAMVVYHFDRTGERKMVAQKYHLDDEGNMVLDDVESYDREGGKPGEGRVPEILTLMLGADENLVTRFDQQFPQGVDGVLQDMASAGFVIMKASGEQIKSYLPVPNEETAEEIGKFLKGAGWEEAEEAP